MNRVKYLAKNTAIFAISQFTSKVMVFLLLPLYTSYMTTEEYGNADLVLSTISLLLPIFTLEITSAVMRFSIENKEGAKPFFNNGISLIIIGFCLLLILIPLFKLFNLFNGYLYLFYILYICNALYQLLSYYARALDKIKLVGIAGVINTLIVIGSNILLLVVLKRGLKGYLISYISGYLTCAVILGIVLRKHISLKLFHFEKKSFKEMLKYSVPLVPNNVSWWGVSSANKYVINGFLTQGILGLYSVALKIPTIINTIQSIFAEALVLSVFEEYNHKEKDVKYFSLLYNVYSYVTIVITASIIFFTRILAKILFAKSFYEAWIFVPLLCIPSVWGALSGYLGTFYAASKKNTGMFLSTLVGGVISVVFSLSTVKTFGVFGIITGNIISYFAIWLYRWINVRQFIKLDVRIIRDISSWILLFAEAFVVIFVKNTWLVYAFNIIILFTIFLVNIKITRLLIGKAIGLFSKLINKKRGL